jgi:CSLREA domain-containing protein
MPITIRGSWRREASETRSVGGAVNARHKQRPANLGAILAILTSLLPGLAQSMYAGTIQVNTTADELNADGDCSLREAIQAANTDVAIDACPAGSGSDVIVVPAGVYTLSVVGAGEDANATGDLDITADLTINGAGASATIVDGAHLDRVFDVAPQGAGVTVTMSGLTIQNGSRLASGFGFGGGIENRGTLILRGTTVRNNVADLAGGIFNPGPGNLTLGDTTVSDNVASGGSGGGIYSSGSLTLERCTVSGNRTGASGGGIENLGTLILTNSTFSGNTGFSGGGLDAGVATITNCTITGNHATWGGGIFIGGALTQLKNTIVAYNTADGSGGDCIGGGATLLGHNLDSDANCGFTGPGDFSGVDPLLGSLGDNGGPTQTRALLDGSPAINAGGDCPPPSTDQRGVGRPQGAACDLGAFELEGHAICVPADCDDGNPCTDDSCDSVSGCVHANNTASCDDNNACTAGDTCGSGVCNPGSPPNCHDDTCCTVESASIVGLGDLRDGLLGSCANGVSADGSVVVGYIRTGLNSEAFRLKDGVVQGLGTLREGEASRAFGVSADGSVVAGNSASGSSLEAFRWENGLMVGLGSLHAGDTSNALAVSDDGQVVVGVDGFSDGSGSEAFRWNNGVMAGLGDLPGDPSLSLARGVSADGSVIVGTGYSDVTFEAFRWGNGVMTSLGSLSAANPFGEAFDVSADGGVVVGAASSLDGYFLEAFRWANGVMSGLGDLPGGTTESTASSVSADGSVIVGKSATGGTDLNPIYSVFIWDAEHGMQDLKRVLVNDLGLDLTGWILSSAEAVSADGRTIVGCGVRAGIAEGWIVRFFRTPGSSCVPVVCDDGNPCTDDSCDPTTGCVHENNTAMCDDGDACTTHDACANGTCAGPVATDCDDGNSCTADSCDHLTGCHHVPAAGCGNHPPICTGADPSPQQLSPPNNRFAPVTISGVTDADGDQVSVTVTTVRQDEQVGNDRAQSAGAGKSSLVDARGTCPDARIVGPSVLLRAERDAHGNGRVYHIGFSASDGHGGTCEGSVVVCVPHDQSGGHTCIDGGPIFDSTGPCVRVAR